MTLDLVFLGCVGIFALIGYFSGFARQVIRIGALVGAYLLAGILGRPFGSMLARSLEVPHLIGRVLGSGLAFFLLYMIFSVVGWSILRKWRKRQDPEKIAVRRRWDGWTGLALGGAKTFVMLYLVLCVIVLVEKPLAKASGKMRKMLSHSFMADLAREHNILSGLHLPAVGNLAAISKAASDPKFREKMMHDPKVKRLLENPKIKALADDKALLAASRRNDLAALLANPRLNRVLDDPEIVKLLSEIDLSGI